MAHRSKEIVLHGTIVDAADYNPQAIPGDLPTIRRNQKITIALDENFWQIMHVKRVKIIIDENDLPKEGRNNKRNEDQGIMRLWRFLLQNQQN